MEPFHCVCRCSKSFLAVLLPVAITHMTAVMTLCTFSITIPMLAWLLGGRLLAANIVLDDITSSTGVICGTNHNHHTYFVLFRNTAQIDVSTTSLRIFFCRHTHSEFDWTVAICHEPSDIPHLSKVCGGVSFETRKTCNNVMRTCSHSSRAERLSPTKRRHPIQRQNRGWQL